MDEPRSTKVPLSGRLSTESTGPEFQQTEFGLIVKGWPKALLLRTTSTSKSGRSSQSLSGQYVLTIIGVYSGGEALPQEVFLSWEE
jgi:hypothetical protein